MPNLIDDDNASENEDEEILLPALPKQYRCCSHTLNLIATTDAAKAKVDAQYKRIHNSSLAKACAIWNSVHRSTKCADVVEKLCGGKLKVPCPTRWNSTFDAIQKLLSFKQQLPAVCEQLQKPKFRNVEIEFLTEYATVMEPLAVALDCLQGEKNCYLGYILPTLFQLKQTFNSLTHLKYCSPLKAAILQGIDDRYINVLDLTHFESKPYILATITIPLFKLKWLSITNQGDVYEACKNVILSEAERVQTSREGGAGESSNTEDTEEENETFFRFLNESSGPNNVPFNNSVAAISQMETLSYLQDKSKDINSLHKYPTIKHIFLEYNTILPSSAPVERAFSTGGQILTPRRNRLTDDMFETLLVLKNKM